MACKRSPEEIEAVVAAKRNQKNVVMKRYLRNYDLEFGSAQEGWEKMRLLLNKELPVQTESSPRKLNFNILVAASLITVFLLNTLALNNAGLITSLTGISTDIAKNWSDTDPENKQAGKVISFRKKVDGNSKTSLSLRGKLSPNAVSILSEHPGLAFKDAANTTISQQIIKRRIDTSFQEIATLLPTVQSLQNDSLCIDSITNADKTPKNRWQLYAGLAVNGTVGKKQNLLPYPTATLQYNVTTKLFLALGLSVGSPVATKHSAVTNTTHLNDTVNNISLYNNVKQYYNAVYADLPLLAGININKKISLQAGLQASILLTAKNKIFVEPYDFQMRVATEALNGPFQVTAAIPVSATDFKVQVRKIDYRFTSGLRYSLKQATFGLSYQHSLQPMLIGDFTSQNKNNLVTLNMQYTIK